MIAGRSPEEISDTALFVEDLVIDSLMTIEMLVMVDKKYRIRIPEEDLRKIRNVNNTVEMVQRYLAAAAG